MQRILTVKTPWGGPVLWKYVTQSTMADAEELHRSGHPNGTVVVADYQSIGVGRGTARRWVSTPRSGLLFSVLLNHDQMDPIEPLSALPLRIGLGVHAILASIVPECRIKWPNDLMISDRKLAGILCVHRAGTTVVGVGINCNQRRFPHVRPDTQTQMKLDEIAVSLRMLSGRAHDRQELLLSVLDSLADSLHRTDWKSQVEDNLWHKGETVTVEGPEGMIGTIAGIGELGELLVGVGPCGEVKSITAGTIRLC